MQVNSSDLKQEGSHYSPKENDTSLDVFSWLPDELIRYITSFLDMRDILLFAMMNKRFNGIVRLYVNRIKDVYSLLKKHSAYYEEEVNITALRQEHSIFCSATKFENKFNQSFLYWIGEKNNNLFLYLLSLTNSTDLTSLKIDNFFDIEQKDEKNKDNEKKFFQYLSLHYPLGYYHVPELRSWTNQIVDALNNLVKSEKKAFFFKALPIDLMKSFCIGLVIPNAYNNTNLMLLFRNTDGFLLENFYTKWHIDDTHCYSIDSDKETAYALSVRSKTNVLSFIAALKELKNPFDEPNKTEENDNNANPFGCTCYIL